MKADVNRSVGAMSPNDRIRQNLRGGPMSVGAPTTFEQSGAVQIIPTQEPIEIAVGDTVTFEYDIRTTVISHIGDPNYCLHAWSRNGLNTDVAARANGSTVSAQNYCLDASHRHNPSNFQFRLEGTSPGTVEVEVEAFSAHDGELFADYSVVIEVVDTGGGGGGGGGGGVNPGTPPDTGDDGDGGGAILPCWIDPNHSCTPAATVGWAAGGAMFGLFAINAVLD